MNILDKYPVFENNQVLTSDQLNNLSDYLDQQNRLTRARLIGIGAICGFNIISKSKTLLISKGIGITSNGFLIAQGDCSTTKYRKYLLPETVRYSPFEDTTTNEQDVDLFELLTSDFKSDVETTPIEEDFLKDKVVILFLEIFDKDLKTCLAKSCDEIGQTREFTLRKLLISTTDLDKVLQRLKIISSYDPTFPDKFELPVISLPRVTIRPDELAASDRLELLKKYRDASQSVIDELIAAIKQTYTIYQPVLENLYKKDYFGNSGVIDGIVINWDAYLANESGENPLYGMQYFYDFVKDLILAYNEFKNTAFELCNECIIDLERFPQHLMVGPAIPPDNYNIDSTPYRNRYIQSPAYSQQKYLTDKARSLHQRIVSMIISFKLEYISSPDNGINNTYIIPSNEKVTCLSQRSIPFYYIPEKKELPLINCWNYDLEKRKVSDYILTYHHQSNTNDPIKSPLKYDIDKYPFLRIEGILGNQIDTLKDKINNRKTDFNLPFNVVTLKINPSSDTLVLEPSMWKDLEQLYSEARCKFICSVQNLYEAIKNLEKFSLPLEYTTIDSYKTKAFVKDLNKILRENIDDFIFPEFFLVYCNLLELLHEYRLCLIHYRGKLIHVLINVITLEEFQDKITIIEESLDIIQKILDNCIYKELYQLYYRLIGRKEYLLKNHPVIFSNFLKKHPGIEHSPVKKGGTIILVNEDNIPSPDTEGKSKVFADFSLPYLCCCECTDMPSIEQDLKDVQLPDLAVPDSAICLVNEKIEIDIIKNDIIQNIDNSVISTNNQYAKYDPDKKLAYYQRDSFTGLDTFYYTINSNTQPGAENAPVSGQELKIMPADLKSGDLFGFSIDIDKDRAIVGALKGGENLVNSGSAYILEYKDSQWVQQAKLNPADKKNNDQFGFAVAINDNYAFVGAVGDNTGGTVAGSVYVFAYENGNWAQKQKLQPNDIIAGDYFGCSLAISNNLLVIGAFGKDSSVKKAGCAYVYKLEANQWVQKQKIVAGDPAEGDYFGYSVALYNNNLAIGAYCKDAKGPNSGCVYAFLYNGTQFIQKQKIVPNDNQADDYFGSSLAVYGNNIVAGARRNDIGGKNSGCAYTFYYQDNKWKETKKLVPFDAESGDYFGYSVDIYKDSIIMGSRYEDKGGENAGCAYLFTFHNGDWEQSKKIQPGALKENDLFGSAVGIYENNIIIGAHKDDTKGDNAGSIYILPKQYEVLNNVGLVKVLVRNEYKLHILAKDDLEILPQYETLLIDVLKNDVYYNTTDIILPSPSSTLGGAIVKVESSGKKMIQFTPKDAGKDTFRYRLKDDTRNEISEATVSVFVTKVDLTPDIVYLVTSPDRNNVPIVLEAGCSINSISSIPAGMGSLTIDAANSAIVFIPGNEFAGSKTLSFSYVILNAKNEHGRGVVHLINAMDEYSIPDIVYLVSKTTVNTIPLEYAKSTGLPVIRIDNLPGNMGTYTTDNTEHTINFIPGVDFTAQNTLKFYYYLKSDTGSSIRGTIHLINGIEEYSIPDKVYLVKNAGNNIIPVDYAQQYSLPVQTAEILPSNNGTYSIDNTKHTINFIPGGEFTANNSVRLVYYIKNTNNLLIKGTIHLINGLEEHSIPDTVYIVTSRAGNDILIEYAQQNSFTVNKVELSNTTFGSCTFNNKTVTFTPNANFEYSNTLRLTYYLINDKNLVIKGIIHLVNGIKEITVPDIVYQVTTLGQTSILVDFAVQYGYEIVGLVGEVPKDVLNNLSFNKQSVTFETLPNFQTKDYLSFGYILSKSGEKQIIGFIHLINGIKQGDFEEYFENVMAGTIMAFASDPTAGYEVILISPGTDPSKILDIIMSITGLSDKDAKALISLAPVTIKKGLPKKDAENIYYKLEKIGATVEIAATKISGEWLNKIGWLICDGSQYVIDDYQRLFERIGFLYGNGDASGKYFNVPNLQGEFLRGWVNEQEKIRGRGLGKNTKQEDQFQSHTHSEIEKGHTHTDGSNGHSHSSINFTNFQNNQKPHMLSASTFQDTKIIAANTGNQHVSLDMTKVSVGNPENSKEFTEPVRSGNETRPKNYAVIFCIKY